MQFIVNERQKFCGCPRVALIESRKNLRHFIHCSNIRSGVGLGDYHWTNEKDRRKPLNPEQIVLVRDRADQ